MRSVHCTKSDISFSLMFVAAIVCCVTIVPVFIASRNGGGSFTLLLKLNVVFNTLMKGVMNH